MAKPDEGIYKWVKHYVALYRLAFGQPRQEDLLEILRRNGRGQEQTELRSLRINLMP